MTVAKTLAQMRGRDDSDRLRFRTGRITAGFFGAAAMDEFLTGVANLALQRGADARLDRGVAWFEAAFRLRLEGTVGQLRPALAELGRVLP